MLFGNKRSISFLYLMSQISMKKIFLQKQDQRQWILNFSNIAKRKFKPCFTKNSFDRPNHLGVVQHFTLTMQLNRNAVFPDLLLTTNLLTKFYNGFVIIFQTKEICSIAFMCKNHFKILHEVWILANSDYWMWLIQKDICNSFWTLRMTCDAMCLVNQIDDNFEWGDGRVWRKF